jgi:hypothetical protein
MNTFIEYIFSRRYNELISAKLKVKFLLNLLIPFKSKKRYAPKFSSTLHVIKLYNYDFIKNLLVPAVKAGRAAV